MRLLIACGILVATLGTTAAVHHVDSAATDEDRTYGAVLLERAGYSGSPEEFGELSGFDAQIAAVLAVQDAVLEATPIETALPTGGTREPRDIAEAGQGLCFDRSRAIEKILDGFGLETRHVSMYSIKEQGRLRAMMTPGVRSHALTEVRTERGWMLVDSNARWIALTGDGRVLSAEDLQSIDYGSVEWADVVPEPFSWMKLDDPFTYMYGLYSRHGGFYPPYTPIPDVNYRQLLHNL